jgi:hypothetical protein
MYGIEHHHAVGNVGGVLMESPAFRVAAPDSEGGVHRESLHRES